MTADHDISTWDVLIVDDHADSREVACLTLSLNGASVTPAEGGAQALALLEHMQPTLILLDLSMPELDGWEVLTRIRENPRTAEIPVVALTAHAMRGDKQRVLEAGFDHYISKPFSPMTLINDLMRTFDGKSEFTP